MSEIKYRYFITTGPKADAVIAEMRAGIAEHEKNSKAVRDKYGADATWGNSHTAPVALAYTGDEHAAKKPGFKEPYTGRSGDTLYHLHKPNRATKIGKECAEALSQCQPFDLSRHAGKAFGLYKMTTGISHGRMVASFTAAGVYGNSIVFRVPIKGDDGEDDDIVPPDDVREIKHSEFVAITEEGAEVPA